ncbi:MAG: hypothetical protein FD180_4954 [Planctomycetota bacterium]|nr:MAG: hypothetical protein FD180_4954 [Planctomycetota bacterium]
MYRALGVVLVFACALPASADNLATEWMDRVTHEVQKESGPLSTRPVDFHLYGGVYGLYTDNIFLKNNRLADGDSAAIGMVRGRIDYSDSQFEISADALFNFDYYMEHHEAREDEERFYGKIRYADGVFELQLVEIARREHDPLDGIFSDKVRRLITDTLPRVGVRFSDLFKAEAYGQIETVHFEGSDFDGRENENYRGGITLLADVTQRISIGLDGGFHGIHYRQEETTQHAEGIFARAVLRGELLPRLLIEVAAGWTGIRHRDPEELDEKKKTSSTLDAELHIRYEATDKITLFADYTRRFGFAGFGDPYQQVDRVVLIGEWEMLEGLKLRARGQYDHVRPSIYPVHSFWKVSLGLSYQIIENLTVDGGVIYRGGDTRGVKGDDYDNWIFYVGAVVGF